MVEWSRVSWKDLVLGYGMLRAAFPFTQQAHIPNSIMTILEASGKQEPDVKEASSGPLEEVRAMWPTCLCFWP